MEDKSTICSGSHLHRRSFNPEEPWLSLESTILGGNVTFAEESSDSNGRHNGLSTVGEESQYTELEPIVDDNVLNMNIDAISDDEVFFDCATSPSPSPKKSFNSLQAPKTPCQKPKQHFTPRFGQFLRVDDCKSAWSSQATEASSMSSSVEPDQRTGGLLVQIVDDFNDMKDHAQSTPKLEETDSGYFQLPAKSDLDASRRSSPAKQRPAATPRKYSKSPTYKPMSPTNKQKYYRKYSHVQPTDRLKAPLRHRRVTLMKQYFESISKESQKLNQSSASVHLRPSQKLQASTFVRYKSAPKLNQSPSPSIRHKTMLRKSPRINDLRSLSSESSYKKRAVRNRPSSCSDISSTETSASRDFSRSKSTSDATGDDSADKITTQRLNNVAIRRYMLLNQRSTLHKNSSKDSTIKKRKSLGLIVSPIKPVQEIRKIFSPRFQVPV